MIETDVAVTSGLRLTCSRDDLAEQLTLVSRAVSTRSAVQVLQGVLLRAEGGRLHLAATDMELSLRASLEADVSEEGAVVVPGRLLGDIARLLPEGEVSLSAKRDEGSLYVECGTASYRVQAYSVEDFPRLPEVDTVQTFEIEGPALMETIGRVSRAASRDESRPVLTGVLVQFEGQKLVMAATDSYRLAVKETDLGAAAPALEAIVPARALGELARIAGDAESIELGVLENQIVFQVDGVWLTTRRIDGQFPNYRQLLPDSFEHEVRASRSELADVVRRVSVMAERSNPLRLRFAEGELTASTQTPDVGEAKESLPVEFGGEPLEIGFNPGFLREGIESIDSDEVVLRLISPLRPVVIQGASEDYTYLLMPIRLPG
ncbi:MAG: DNA polymerase III subunit beta [Gaiellaceae bacterium]